MFTAHVQATVVGFRVRHVINQSLQLVSGRKCVCMFNRSVLQMLHVKNPSILYLQCLCAINTIQQSPPNHCRSRYLALMLHLQPTTTFVSFAQKEKKSSRLVFSLSNCIISKISSVKLCGKNGSKFSIFQRVTMQNALLKRWWYTNKPVARQSLWYCTPTV